MTMLFVLELQEHASTLCIFFFPTDPPHPPVPRLIGFYQACHTTQHSFPVKTVNDFHQANLRRVNSVCVHHSRYQMLDVIIRQPVVRVLFNMACTFWRVHHAAHPPDATLWCVAVGLKHTCGSLFRVIVFSIFSHTKHFSFCSESRIDQTLK